MGGAGSGAAPQLAWKETRLEWMLVRSSRAVKYFCGGWGAHYLWGVLHGLEVLRGIRGEKQRVSVQAAHVVHGNSQDIALLQRADPAVLEPTDPAEFVSAEAQSAAEKASSALTLKCSGWGWKDSVQAGGNTLTTLPGDMQMTATAAMTRNLIWKEKGFEGSK